MLLCTHHPYISLVSRNVPRENEPGGKACRMSEVDQPLEAECARVHISIIQLEGHPQKAVQTITQWNRRGGRPRWKEFGKREALERPLVQRSRQKGRPQSFNGTRDYCLTEHFKTKESYWTVTRDRMVHEQSHAQWLQLQLSYLEHKF